MKKPVTTVRVVHYRAYRTLFTKFGELFINRVNQEVRSWHIGKYEYIPHGGLEEIDILFSKRELVVKCNELLELIDTINISSQKTFERVGLLGDLRGTEQETIDILKSETATIFYDFVDELFEELITIWELAIVRGDSVEFTLRKIRENITSLTKREAERLTERETLRITNTFNDMRKELNE